MKNNFKIVGTTVALASAAAISARAAEVSTNAFDDSTAPRVRNDILPAPEKPADASSQNWNWHVQNTDIVQGYPGFSAKYSGPNSLPTGGETRETVSLDLMAGVRLWQGAEAHIDGLMWQGFGLNNTLGVEGFPNGEAFRLGTDAPNGAITRLFIRQTIGLGGEQEDVPDDQLTLAGKQDISRLTFTIGRFSAKDIFDNNTYANDPRTQFMNWALMANVVLGAWIHVGSTIQHLNVASVGDELTVRARVTDNYERKRHKFVNLDGVIVANGTTPIAHCQHIAIYQPRETVAA